MAAEERRTRRSPSTPSGREGERETFRALYERAAPPLRRYLGRMTGSQDLAEDLLQDAFVRYLGAETGPMTEAETMSYLYTIATRLVYDSWRRERVERRWRDTLPPGDEAAAPLALASDLDSALDAMPPRDRALLWLAYVEDRPHREIAEIVGVRELSVRVMLFRARRRMAAILHERGLAPESHA